MKKMRNKIIEAGALMIACLMSLTMLFSCGDEPHSKVNKGSDGTGGGGTGGGSSTTQFNFKDWEGSVSGKEKDLIGTWYCMGEKWLDWGKISEESYEPSDKLGMIFNTDHTGRFFIFPPYSSLLEIGSNGTNGKSYSWTMTKLGKEWVVRTTDDVYGSKHDYIIKLLDSNRLILLWDDDEFKVAAKFIKAY